MACGGGAEQIYSLFKICTRCGIVKFFRRV